MCSRILGPGKQVRSAVARLTSALLRLSLLGTLASCAAAEKQTDVYANGAEGTTDNDAAASGGAANHGTGGAGTASSAGSGTGGSGVTCTGDDCGSDSACTDASKLAYVVDRYTDAIYRFDPPRKAFSRVASVAGCGSLPEGTIGQELRPFSMSVGRNGHAYVLYYMSPANGGVGIWEIDLDGGACLGKNPYDALHSTTFSIFGMGFATDSDGNTTDSLYIAGPFGGFGKLDLTAGTVETLGKLDGSPELTGNAKGQLFGFFPSSPSLNEIDKTSGAIAASHPLSGMPASKSYANAYYGGAFYLFVGIDQGSDVNAKRYSEVWKVDAETFAATKYMSIEEVAIAAGVTGGLRVVGAGASTCVPIIPPII